MILGFQGTSLVNYPNEICSIIFLSDCNYHCPYCYNKSLVFPSRDNQPLLKDYVIEELRKRENFITGVCITGGEPTLYHFDLIKLIEDIKTMCPNLKIKLDTNGSRPDVLKNLFSKEFFNGEAINYVAMDYKTAPSEYKDLISKFDVGEAIIESMEVIRSSFQQNNYEFRITALREMMTKDVVRKMSKHLMPGDTVYIQNFKFMGEANHINIKTFSNPKTLSFTLEEAKELFEPISKKCNVSYRNF